MATADFNHDGAMDLAVTDWVSSSTDTDGNQISGGVWLYLGKAGGGYDAPLFYATGNNPYGVAAVDLNADGKPDLVVAHNEYLTAGQVSVLIGNGDGTFQAHQDYTVSSSGAAVGAVAVGDVNGGGILDVVTVDKIGHIFVVPVKADGTLDTASLQTLTQAPDFGAYNNVSLSDINGDGTLDVVTDDTENVNVFYGQSMLATTPDQQVPLPDDSATIAVGDFNEDGHPDVAVASYEDENLRILFNQGGKLALSGSFFSFPYDVGPWGTMSATDIDGDGHLDLFVGDDYCDGDSSYILYGSGDGKFTNPAPVPAGNCAISVATIDAGNGLRNLLTATAWDGGVVTEARNLGDRKFFTYATYPYAVADGGDLYGDDGNDMASADFNGDGYVDLVVADSDDGALSLLLNNGHGGFEAPVLSRLPDGDLYSVATADVNGDGNADIVVPADNDELYTYLGDGTGGFPFVTATSIPNAEIGSVVTGDIDGDGKPDLLLSDNDDSVVLPCKGDGTGAFDCTAYAPIAATNPTYLTLTDFNGDGHADFVVGSGDTSGANAVAYVYTGDGAGGFALSATLNMINVAGTSAYANVPQRGAVGDVNGDGKLDFLVGSRYITADLFLGNGDGTFAAATVIATGYSDNADWFAEPHAVAFADINGDGMLDLVAGNAAEADIGVAFGKGDGTFATPQVFAGNVSNDIAMLDMDNDGQQDIVSLSPGWDDLVSSTVNVYLHNHAPVVQSLELKTDQDTAVSGQVEVADAEQNGYTVAIATQPAHGKVSGLDAATGKFTYTPATGYTGADSFTVTASDGMNTSGAATVKVSVQAVAPSDDGGDTGDTGDTGNTPTPNPTPSSGGGGGGLGMLALLTLGLVSLRRRIR